MNMEKNRKKIWKKWEIMIYRNEEMENYDKNDLEINALDI